MVEAVTATVVTDLVTGQVGTVVGMEVGLAQAGAVPLSPPPPPGHNAGCGFPPSGRGFPLGNEDFGRFGGRGNNRRWTRGRRRNRRSQSNQAVPSSRTPMPVLPPPTGTMVRRLADYQVPVKHFRGSNDGKIKFWEKSFKDHGLKFSGTKLQGEIHRIEVCADQSIIDLVLGSLDVWQRVSSHVNVLFRFLSNLFFTKVL